MSDNEVGDKFYVYEFRTRRIRRPVAIDLSDRVLKSPEHVASIVRYMTKGDARESFFVILLDAVNHILGFEVIATGGLTSVTVHPREVFRPAIINAAAAIILAHNHPSGAAAPSDEDIELTHQMVSVGELIGIPICDHVVVTETDYVSLRERDLMKGSKVITILTAAGDIQ